jgi:hypothetical protein
MIFLSLYIEYLNSVHVDLLIKVIARFISVIIIKSSVFVIFLQNL